ncbi:FAD/NAD(P)-binding domain-containing protein [Gymnopus androsaceus JB14]|uniref:FAD/NAD(P)-binding domain-containing protein n=1 Tax=Gymnopus androsaceus JB14 TaxID=1447944 RepID=A0A6A4I9A8_9AGAR|nr:FAD/NAD(P)-binding domain-containing protein [Gymnopus androsaceus JB14]
MKIIIIGTGIGGLAAYHALSKHLPSADLAIYDGYPSPLKSNKHIGGGISLGPNGQRAMKDITPEALSFIRDRAFEYSAVIFQSDSGKVLGQMPFGSKERYQFGQLMTTRSTVHEGLLLERGTNEKVHWNTKVARTWETDDAAYVQFEDGTIEKCDLLIGADGARSVTRNAIFGEEYAPHYDGLIGFGGFIPLTDLTPFTREAIQGVLPSLTVGRIGGFGYAFFTPLSSPEPKLFWWAHAEMDTPLPRDTPRNEMLPLLMQRYGKWRSPHDDPSDPENTIFRQILTIACEGKDDNNWFMLPRYFTPLLPHWTSLHGLSATGSETGAPTTKAGGRIVLLGDAAHAMPPEGAQGVSCAVEDSLTLALLLKHYSKSETEAEAIAKAAKSYEDIRLPRVNKILVEAKGRADQKRQISWMKDKIREFGVWVISWIPESFLHDEVFGYDVEVHVAKYLEVPQVSL